MTCPGTGHGPSWGITMAYAAAAHLSRRRARLVASRGTAVASSVTNYCLACGHTFGLEHGSLLYCCHSIATPPLPHPDHVLLCKLSAANSCSAPPRPDAMSSSPSGMVDVLLGCLSPCLDHCPGCLDHPHFRVYSDLPQEVMSAGGPIFPLCVSRKAPACRVCV